MTYPQAVVVAACELAHALRWPALVVVVWFVGYALLGPMSTWGWP
jgi:hypothetical protein